MIRWILSSSLKFRYLVTALAVALVYFGSVQVRNMPVDVFPEFAPPRIDIQTLCLGLSPAEVESLVSVPIENALAGIPGVDVMRSISVPQLSRVRLIFKNGTDDLPARQMVTERMALVIPHLPTWAAPPVVMPPVSSLSRVMKIGITSKDKSVMDLSMLAYWNIRSKLLGVRGVANVAIWGEQLKILQVEVDPEHLAELNVTLDEVQETVSDALDVGLLRYSDGAHIGTGGFIESGKKRKSLRFISTGVTPETLARVPVDAHHAKPKADGTPLLLSDVATLVYAPQAAIGDAVINDGPGLMLIIEKFPWGNTIEVTKGVEAALEEMKPGLPGIEIDTTIFRPATFIELSIENLSHALLFGCFLVIVVIALFLYEWRTALVCIIAIPVSLLAAGLVLQEQAATINTMVLAGFIIALGVVVDDAILDVENIMRRLREHRAGGGTRSTARIILEASLEVRAPIVYATMIIILAVVPVLFLEGVAGSFFRPLVMSYIMAILASLAVAMTLTPALCLILLDRARLSGRESPLVVWLRNNYSRLLERATHSPKPAYVTVGVVMVAGIAVTPLLGYELMPEFKERDFLMHWVTHPGSAHMETVRMTTRASKEVRTIPGVRNFGAHIGQAFLADEMAGMNFSENWISVDPKADYDKTVAAIQEMVDGYPGLYRNVLTFLRERVSDVLSGSSEAISVKIFGPDLQVLRDKADEVLKAMKPIPGLAELHKELMVQIPHIQIKVKLDEARHYGLKPGDVRRATATLLAGTEVGDIFIGGKTYDVQVWTPPRLRTSMDDVRKLLINTPIGKPVRLDEIADLRMLPTPNLIKRENGSRRFDIGANVVGRDLSAVAHDVQRALKTVHFPLGYHAVLEGEYAELEAAQSRLTIFTTLAVIAIFLVLQMSFRSWRMATLSFLTLPSALVGGILAILATEGVISLGALVGFLTVLGIAARNGIMMINHLQHLERHEGETFGMKLVLRGATERLRPIMMTTLAAGLAVVPLVVAGDLPGHEIEYPMAIVILGGLLTSTPLNLFVVPALYLRFGKGNVQASTVEEETGSALPAGRLN